MVNGHELQIDQNEKNLMCFLTDDISSINKDYSQLVQDEIVREFRKVIIVEMIPING